MGELRSRERRRARQILVPPFPEQHTLELPTIVRYPQITALLLIQIVAHDLMLDLVHEVGAPFRTRVGE